MSSAARALEEAKPRSLPQPLTTICAVLAAVGVVAFVVALMQDPQTAWLSFHVNFIYFATLAQGGLCLACAIVIIDANWPGPVRHVAEGLAAWVPISAPPTPRSLRMRESSGTLSP